MSAKPKQLNLAPTAPIRTEHIQADVDQLMKGRLTGPAPDPEFLESVRSLGLLQPVVVEQLPRAGLKLVAGKRRLKAFAILRDQEPPEDFSGTVEEWRALWSTIPAELIPSNGWNTAGARLAENEHRSDNFAELCDDLEALGAAGLSEREIRQETGIPRSRIRRALKIAALHPVLREGFRRGEIVTRVAEAAARCSPEQQAKLVEIFQLEGQLTAASVREVRAADKRAAEASLLGAAGNAENTDGWVDEVVRKLREALDLIPGYADPELREALVEIIDELDEEDGKQRTGPEPKSEP